MSETKMADTFNCAFVETIFLESIMDLLTLLCIHFKSRLLQNLLESQRMKQKLFLFQHLMMTMLHPCRFPREVINFTDRTQMCPHRKNAFRGVHTYM